jgi:hypothetical protein
MSISEPIKSFGIRVLPGMNNLVEELDLKDKWVTLAQNCRFEEELGAIDKRDPVSYFNSSNVGSGAVMGLYRFYTSTGNIQFIIVHGTKAYVGDDTTGTLTEIRANLTEGKRMAFETYKDQCIMSNGFDNMFVYDGASDNVTWELGAMKAALGSGAGNLDASADYYYAVTFDNDAVVNGAVSNTVATDGSNQKIELTNIPLGPTGTTNRKIYRVEGDGSALKLLATIADNTTTTYSDNTADGGLGAAYPAVTDDMPKGSILKIHRERLFISGDPNNPSKIYYSNVYLPHFIQQTTNLDYLEISPEDGDEIMGIPIQHGVMLCIKKNTIRRLHVTSAVSGADPATWYADDPVSFIGSPAQWSITQTPYGIIFLGWDHWYLFDGASSKAIIDEFDTKEILPSNYYDVVGFWHEGIMLAAYSDKTIASQFNDRIMHYNFKRKALAIDIWTSTTVSGANCFAAKTGDDETGELYYGDSQNGYIVKAKPSEDLYRLRTKTEVNEGTGSNVFIGGTENSPYIEIGAVTAATAIPDDICIFWEDDTETPGPGWTEVDAGDKMIYISTTAGNTGGSGGHTHNVSGTLLTSNEPKIDGGDSDYYPGNTRDNHTHNQPAQASSSDETYPRHIKLRIFKKNSSTTEYEFPDGAIIMWDQPTAPTGWQEYGTDGYYIRHGSSGLGTNVASTHSHTFSVTCSQGGIPEDSGNPGATPPDAHARWDHVHVSSGTSSTADMSSLEFDYVGFTFIKKVGESDTWDGTSQYCYALYDGSGSPSGWTDSSSTYDGKYLKILNGTISTGSAANGSHNHTITNDWSGYQTLHGSGYGGYHHAMIEYHRHQYDLDMSSTSVTSAPYRTFKIYKKILGQMRDYNTAITSQYTSGTWTSPAQQINAETLNKMFWNELITDTVNDNILIHTRTGATESACTSASWSSGLTDPNGSTIASTAAAWIQYKIEFTADDTRNNNPRVYFSDGFVVKYSYEKGATYAETSVNWKYEIGFRNLDSPFADKIFKKIHIVHEGEQASFVVEWETEHANNSFTISLASYPARWESYFHDTALGREINLAFSKNDLYSFRLSEIKTIYTHLPVLL